MNNIYCGDCKFLNPTEEQQSKMRIKPNHFCKKFKKVVLHGDQHPNLPKFEECITISTLENSRRKAEKVINKKKVKK